MRGLVIPPGTAGVCDYHLVWQNAEGRSSSLEDPNLAAPMADDFYGFPIRRLLLGPSADWRVGSAAHADWIETSSAHILRINAPGMGRDEVKVQLEEGNVLHVRGELASSKEEPTLKDAVWHIAERGKGEFSRRFALPADVKVDHIKAHIENGVVTVVAPKETSPPKPKSRTISVSSKL